MSIAVQVAQVLSLVSFLFYGLHCVFSEHAEKEFSRYGLSGFRRLTGVLEIAGALGLAMAFVYPMLLPVAAAGLALLMALGVGARLRVRDRLPALLPALFFFAVNVFLLAASLRGF